MKLTELSDEELMVMYQAGSNDAFKVLYARHSQKIYGYLRGRVWNDALAAELYQDAFLKLHKSKHLYNKTLPALPWIFSVTKSVLIDGLRKEKRANRDKEDTVIETSLTEIAPAFGNAADLLAQLPANQRKVMELRYIDEKTFEEIATLIDTSAENVRKIVSRAIAKLKSFATKE